MGMFDSLYDAEDREWQTKAFECNLDVYRIGDTIAADGPMTCQVEVMRHTRREGATDSFATFVGGVLVAVPAERDHRLPLLDYSGRLIETGRALVPTHTTEAHDAPEAS